MLGMYRPSLRGENKSPKRKDARNNSLELMWVQGGNAAFRAFFTRRHCLRARLKKPCEWESTYVSTPSTFLTAACSLATNQQLAATQHKLSSVTALYFDVKMPCTALPPLSVLLHCSLRVKGKLRATVELPFEFPLFFSFFSGAGLNLAGIQVHEFLSVTLTAKRCQSLLEMNRHNLPLVQYVWATTHRG